jgi:hypothetical protein
MSFKDFYLCNTPFELRVNTSFVPFFDGMYIHSGSISYLNVENMHMDTKKADLDDIINKYNANNVIKFKRKPITMEDRLIPKEIFNNIQFSIDLIDNMNYQEILSEFKLLGFNDELINPLNDILNSFDQRVIHFDYRQLTDLQNTVQTMYNKLIHSIIARNK